MTDKAFENITVGESASFKRILEAADIEVFAKLSGDFNPLHMDDVYAATTPLKRRVVHGMFLGSLCSQLVGMHLPGKRCLYITQTLSFIRPVFIGDTVTVRGEVIHKSPATRMLDIAIVISSGNTICVKGVAQVQVREH